KPQKITSFNETGSLRVEVAARGTEGRNIGGLVDAGDIPLFDIGKNDFLGVGTAEHAECIGVIKLVKPEKALQEDIQRYVLITEGVIPSQSGPGCAVSDYLKVVFVNGAVIVRIGVARVAWGKTVTCCLGGLTGFPGSQVFIAPEGIHGPSGDQDVFIERDGIPVAAQTDDLVIQQGQGQRGMRPEITGVDWRDPQREFPAIIPKFADIGLNAVAPDILGQGPKHEQVAGVFHEVIDGQLGFAMEQFQVGSDIQLFGGFPLQVRVSGVPHQNARCDPAVSVKNGTRVVYIGYVGRQGPVRPDPLVTGKSPTT